MRRKGFSNIEIRYALTQRPLPSGNAVAAENLLRGIFLEPAVSEDELTALPDFPAYHSELWIDGKRKCVDVDLVELCRTFYRNRKSWFIADGENDAPWRTYVDDEKVVIAFRSPFEYGFACEHCRLSRKKVSCPGKGHEMLCPRRRTKYHAWRFRKRDFRNALISCLRTYFSILPHTPDKEESPRTLRYLRHFYYQLVRQEMQGRASKRQHKGKE